MKSLDLSDLIADVHELRRIAHVIQPLLAAELPTKGCSPPTI
jgi:hypothetical protein